MNDNNVSQNDGDKLMTQNLENQIDELDALLAQPLTEAPEIPAPVQKAEKISKGEKLVKEKKAKAEKPESSVKAKRSAVVSVRKASLKECIINLFIEDPASTGTSELVRKLEARGIPSSNTLWVDTYTILNNNPEFVKDASHTGKRVKWLCNVMPAKQSEAA